MGASSGARRMRRLHPCLVIPTAIVTLVALFVATFEPPSETLLRRLGVPPAAHALSAVDVIPVEGTQMETASWSFRVRASAEDVRAFYRQRCNTYGLIRPSASRMQASPDLLCEGYPRIWRSNLRGAMRCVVRCGTQHCHVRISVSVIR